LQKLLNTNKKEIRERISHLLNNQEEKERVRKSLIIENKLFKLAGFAKAKTILFYASFDGEVDTYQMIRKAQKLGKKIALPVIAKERRELLLALIGSVDESLQDGPYGIKEPILNETNQISADVIDFVVVPGVAFDKNRNRLGRGGGYYDRFLARLAKNIPTAGLAFDFQIVDQLPVERHDFAVTSLITN